VSYELHPETPVAGIPMARRFSGPAVERLFAHIRDRGAEFGLVFNRVALLANSRIALEASEFARDAGCYDVFHERMFRAYFTDLLDIGRLDVVCQIAAECGLDAHEVQRALRERRYAARLAEAREEGERSFVSGIPTFVVGGRHQIIGAQPLDIFTNLLRKLEQAGEITSS
jgi:predicted DsbA family dithiol-disulfide isomerase